MLATDYKPSLLFKEHYKVPIFFWILHKHMIQQVNSKSFDYQSFLLAIVTRFTTTFVVIFAEKFGTK